MVKKYKEDTMFRKKVPYFILLIILFFPMVVLGNDKVEVTPYIIEDRAKAKEILKYSITIINNSENKVDLYPIVSDISIVDGQKESLGFGQLDKSTSLARWIRISRGVIELSPGEKREIPLEIDVGLTAATGKYYATVVFSEGSNRKQAENLAKQRKQPTVNINLEIYEHIVERAQLNSFTTDREIYFEIPVNFFVEITNTGNRAIKPRGFISVYNRRGEEISSIDINPGQEEIQEGANKQLDISWGDSKTMGRFKAKLTLEYGENDKRDIQDTFYFWVLPWQYLSIFFGSLLLVAIILSIVIFSQTYKRGHHKTKNRDDGVIDLKNK